MSKYTDMVDTLVRTCSDKMTAASDDARLRLREWDLPECLDALSAGSASGLPDALRGELEALDSAGGLTHLMDMATQIRVCVGGWVWVCIYIGCTYASWQTYMHVVDPHTPHAQPTCTHSHTPSPSRRNTSLHPNTPPTPRKNTPQTPPHRLCVPV